MDIGYWIMDTTYCYWILDTGYWIINIGQCMMDGGIVDIR